MDLVSLKSRATQFFCLNFHFWVGGWLVRRSWLEYKIIGGCQIEKGLPESTAALAQIQVTGLAIAQFCTLASKHFF
jgi:hypothetical protein